MYKRQILESISGLEPSSGITEPRYLKLVTASSFCPVASTQRSKCTSTKSKTEGRRGGGSVRNKINTSWKKMAIITMHVVSMHNFNLLQHQITVGRQYSADCLPCICSLSNCLSAHLPVCLSVPWSPFRLSICLSVPPLFLWLSTCLPSAG